jgi:hypothetical protein
MKSMPQQKNAKNERNKKGISKAFEANKYTTILAI